jgi:pimeloyl-ACP methyl ester carboxylesterase
MFQAGGFTLERFDYRGTGEAGGEFADVLLETLREDVITQVAGDEVCLIGLRFGASLALDYCTRSLGSVRNLILLEPITNGAKYVDYLYRKQHIKDLMTGKSVGELRDKGYVNLEGYKTNVRFIEQIESLNVVEMTRERTVRSSVFIVQISNRSKINSKIESLARLLESSARRVLVENVELPMFWERVPSTDYAELTRKVLEWCRG